MGVFMSRGGASAARFFRRIGLAHLNRRAKAMLKRVTGDVLTIDVDGLRMQGPVDSWNLLHQLQTGTFERFECELFVDAIRPGMTVLDLGANIGYYTLLASRAVGHVGSVYAFEPDPRSFRSLCANVEVNGARNVRTFEAAVSARPGSRTLYLSETATHSGLHRSMGDANPTPHPIDTVALDDLHIARVDVVKMDIEGEEPAALDGMRETLRRNPQVIVFLELSPSALTASGRDAEAFAAYLQTRFVSTRVIDEGQRKLSPFRLPLANKRLNLLCTGIRDDRGRLDTGIAREATS
jgi:FkbM family methyltransferase